MNLFQKSAAGLSLTPAERALLKLVQGFVTTGLAAVAAAIPVALTYLLGQPQLTQKAVLGAALFVAGVFIHAVAASAAKYYSAKGDAPLASAITSVDAVIQQRLPQAPNAVKSPA